VQNFPIHGEGSGTLSTDRSAQLDMTSNVEGRVVYNATLGARPTEAPEGSASPSGSPVGTACGPPANIRTTTSSSP
jgi:hypothetical protein